MEPTVLLVDDETKVTEGLMRAMFTEPFRLLAASSAREALAILEREPIRVIVSDEQMPGMSGSELLTVVRRRHPAVARIVLSGHAGIDATIRAINDAQVFRYLRKPCPAEEVAATIRAALGTAVDETGVSVALDAQFSASLQTTRMVAQPIVSVRQGRPVALEMLARFDHPELGTVSRMLDAAERLDRVVDFDLAVFERVARLAPFIRPELDLFVNIHPRSLTSDRLWGSGSAIGTILGRVVVEITERALVHDGPGLQESLARIRSRGARIAVDDLGVGHATFASVAACAPELIKLDMSLIRDVHKSRVRSEIVGALLRLGRATGARVVAEGIECRAECDHLVKLGCDLFQGYHIALPQPVEDLVNIGLDG